MPIRSLVFSFDSFNRSRLQAQHRTCLECLASGWPRIIDSATDGLAYNASQRNTTATFVGFHQWIIVSQHFFWYPFSIAPVTPQYRPAPLERTTRAAFLAIKLRL